MRIIQLVTVLTVYCLVIAIDCKFICKLEPMKKIVHGGFSQGVQTRQMGSQRLQIVPLFAPTFHRAPKVQFLKTQIVDKALEFWHQALSVKRPSNKKILVRRDCVNDRLRFYPQNNGTFETICDINCMPSAKCHTVEIPQQYLQACRTPQGTTGSDGSGIPGHAYLMVIDASPAGPCSDGWLLAYANACQLEQGTDRPITGYINFCPNRLDENYPMKTILLSTAIHEMGHALGFNRNLYAFYRDESGRPRTPRHPNTGMPNTPQGEFGIYAASQEVVMEVPRIWKSARTTVRRNVAVMVLPNVLKFARSHFNCPNLDGVDLENEGSSATYLTHFEKRVVHDELMAGSAELPSVVSRLTLSVFQDSGWYNVNFNMASEWKWGKNLGCDFVTKSCSEFLMIQRGRNGPTGPWCDFFDHNRVQCATHNDAFNYCNMIRHNEPIPPEKQHITNTNGLNPNDINFLAGESKLHDGCAVFQPIPNLFNEGYTSVCSHEENNRLIKNNPLMQQFGPNSMCVNHGVRWTSGGRNLRDLGASCHKYQCSGGLKIVVGNSVVSCPGQGGEVRVNAQGSMGPINGSAVCPPCGQVCKNC
ncbi:unnamed protein product [Trichobilharzia szidati]|nr:unnamed protein product [Trichobilharzia szidati]